MTNFSWTVDFLLLHSMAEQVYLSMVSNYMSTVHMITLAVSNRIIQEWFMIDSGQIMTLGTYCKSSAVCRVQF